MLNIRGLITTYYITLIFIVGDIYGPPFQIRVECGNFKTPKTPLFGQLYLIIATSILGADWFKRQGEIKTMLTFTGFMKIQNRSWSRLDHWSTMPDRNPG